MRKNTSVAPYQQSQLDNFKNDPFGYVVMGYYSQKHLAKQREYAENSVKQPNELTRGFYKCSATAQKLFVVTVSEFLKLKKNSSDRWVSLEMSDVIFGLNIHDGTATRDIFKKAVNEVGDLHIILQDDEHEFHRLNLIEEVKYNWDWGTLKYKFSEQFASFLEADHKNGFTIFSLEATGKLQSFYSMRYYEIAMSFAGFKGQCKDISQWAKENGVKKENSWFFAYSVEQLRTLFRIKEDEYQDVRNLRKKIVEIPIEELNQKIPELQIKVEKVYKGRKIQGFIFWISETAKVKKLHKKDETKEERNDINQINKENEEVEGFKKKYPEEFGKELIEVQKANTSPLKIELLDEFTVVKNLKTKGFKL